MQTQRHTALIAGLVALLAIGSGLRTPVRADNSAGTVELSLLGGIQALNKNDTALPDRLINVPAAAAITYHFTPVWAAQGEFSWLIPVKRSVDLGAAGTQDRKSPDILAYQANVVAKLPTSAGTWSPYLTAGLGAVTFLSNTDADRLPQLLKSQTAFGINFGGGAAFDLTSRWVARAEFREFAAFPAKDAVGLSNGSTADPIWMERGAVGLGYRF
jgi:opacity protein-like surface antigen